MQTVDFVIIDEGHRLDSQYLLQFFRKDVWIVGMSATWMRSGTQPQLGDTYQDIVATVSTKELIELGYLTPSENYAFQAPLLTGVDIERGTGDYHQAQLQKRFAKPERYAGIIDNYIRICSGKKAVIFTTGSEHCISLCKSFCEAGIAAKYLLSGKFTETDGEYSGERVKLLKDFHDGKFQVLVSLAMLDTGYDEPTLECVILDYSTKSYAKYAQSIGRGSRVSAGKDKFYVLDFGANIQEYGIYEADAAMALWHRPGGNGVMPTKICPPDKQDPTGKLGCNRLIPVSAVNCPFCQYHFSTNSEIYNVELTKVIENEDDGSLESYVAKAKLNGKDNNYILINVCIKNAANPKKAFMEAIKLMQKKDGTYISPQYWHFFSRNILKDKAQKQLAKENAAINDTI
jgi:hypothetical protein